jgi:hypothetical protein
MSSYVYAAVWERERERLATSSGSPSNWCGPRIESRGLRNPAEVEDFLARTGDPAFHLASLPMVSEWGRKPF